VLSIDEIPVLVSGVIIAGVIGFLLVISLGDAYLELVGRLPYWKISAVVLAGLLCLSMLFAGVLGVVVFVVATAIGMVPVRLRARRVHLMGVLIGPLMFGL
jgi:putative membrane protein